jgi:hypothetical protein
MAAGRPEPNVNVQPCGHGDLSDCIVIGAYSFGYASVYKVAYPCLFARPLCADARGILL